MLKLFHQLWDCHMKMKYRCETLLLHQGKLGFLHHRARAVYFHSANQGMSPVTHQSTKSSTGGEGETELQMGDGCMRVSILLNCRSVTSLVIESIKDGCLLSEQIPHIIWSSPASRWGQKQWNSTELWSCILKSTHSKYFSLGWRLGCVFFVLKLWSKAQACLCVFGFFFS